MATQENSDVQEDDLNVVEATDSADEEAGFAEAFGESPAEPAAETEAEDEDTVVDEAAPEDGEPEEAAAEEEQPEEEADPEAQAKADQAHLKALLDSLPSLQEKSTMTEAQIRQLHGKFGEINKLVKDLQSNAAAPAQPVKLTKETFKKLSTDFPEIAEMLAEDLSSLSLPTVRTESQAAPVDVQPIVDAEVSKVRQEFEGKFLTLMHRDWKQVVNSDDFRAWVAKLPADEQNTLNNSWDAEYIGGKISDYKASVKKVDQQREQRNERLLRAITPKTANKVVKGLTTEEDGFNAAFS
jgi:hypothetical protein